MGAKVPFPVSLRVLLGHFVCKRVLAGILTSLNFAILMANNNNPIDDQGREDLDDLNTDENIAGATRLDISGREEEMERLKEELQEQKDKYLRLFAEFDNFRKRSARENLDLRQTAGKEVIISLLDVLDDCDRAEKQLQSTDNLVQIK